MKTTFLIAFFTFIINGLGLAQSQLPVPESVELDAPSLLTSSPSTNTHTVSYGETLYSIAKKYSLSPNDLLRWNRLDKTTKLDKGQMLILNAPPTASLTVAQNEGVLAIPEDKLHTISYGEYPYLIAKKYGISPNDLLKWNDLNEDSKVDFGDKLWLVNPNQEAQIQEVAEKETTTTPIPADFKHEVKYGENLYSVAQKYGITPSNLLKWNNLTLDAKIDKGDKLWLKNPNEQN
jgi:membrane-bound lytic murein transglycosylase D